MVKIILIGHGMLAPTMKDTAEMILGPQPEVTAISFLSSDSMETLLTAAQAELEKNKGKEILVITDLKGGTPWNVCVLLLTKFKHSFALITGMNLGMVLEASILQMSEVSARDIADKLCEVGIASVEKLNL